MSRILKRPMFRKGGEVMEGIMTGIKPRKQYSQGTSLQEVFAKVPGSQRAYDVYSQALKLAAPTKEDILTNLLISGGLNLVSGEGAGKGTLGAIATAYKKPTEEALQQLQGLKGLEGQAALQGLEFGLSKELAKEKGKNIFAAETYAEQFEKRFSEYSEASNPLVKENAANLADFEVRNILKHGKPYIQLSYQYDAKTKKYVPLYNKVPRGFVTLDLSEGKAFERDRDTGEFIELDPFTLKRLEGKIPTGAQ